MKLIARPAIPSDAPQILAFIKELALFEKEPDAVFNTVSDIEKCLFSPEAKAHAVICEASGTAIGFAIYFFNYSTWLGKYGLYLEDLYISESYRGHGAGKFLIKHLAKLAVDRDCGRFEWSVLDWNQPAIEFYESIGAKPQSEWIVYRLTGEALSRFASD